MAPRKEPGGHENSSAPAATNRKRKRDVRASSGAKSSNPVPKDKRRKLHDAREISVQTSEAAFCDGQFDVSSFVNSREYEIKSLLRSMNSSRWGFALAETPTLKCYRPTYRAVSRESCVAFDTSYYATLLLEGQENDLKRCLMRFLPPQDLAAVGRHTVSGETAASTWVYEERGWPIAVIAPVQILWCPWYPGKSDTDVGSKKGDRMRKIALRVHPAAWEDVWKVVASCASSSKCTPHNIRFEIGSIRLAGPKATGVLRTLLHSETLGRDRFGACQLNSAFHRCMKEWEMPQHIDEPFLMQTAVINRIAAIAKDTIPVVIVKEMLGEKARPSISVGRELDSPDCWSIILPWKWVRPFWLTLMRTKGVRFGGLKELEQLTLEGKFGNYPGDFPATRAGNLEAVRRRQESLDRVKRRNAMKVKATTKKDPAGPNLNIVEAEYGYPWDRVFRAAEAEPHSAANRKIKLWHLSPSLTRSLRGTSQSALPPSISHAIFTVHIRLFGRGTVTPDAWVYNLPERGTEAFQQLRLQYARDGVSTAKILESKDGDEQQPAAEAASGSQDSPIGFVMRGNFGYSEGIPVAVAALGWPGAFEGGRQGQDGSSGWCVLRNAEGGIGRLALWEAL
ncbi:hypothetical protein Dda_2908 [Drechslerella dactyloides]|uniref:POPLD domain-containing protein n=1 Tax=Drechslerella dactyloides TaxID=74499 RepID=A0AAD6NMC1_DREDA|nr:hypothetical protein Dda_2908 [Drechslerella dactyloides]